MFLWIHLAATYKSGCGDSCDGAAAQAASVKATTAAASVPIVLLTDGRLFGE